MSAIPKQQSLLLEIQKLQGLHQKYLNEFITTSRESFQLLSKYQINTDDAVSYVEGSYLLDKANASKQAMEECQVKLSEKTIEYVEAGGDLDKLAKTVSSNVAKQKTFKTLTTIGVLVKKIYKDGLEKKAQ